jgi:hypothetical protein
MELIELKWNWKFVAIMFALAAFVCGVSFDMIANWDTKKREDLRLLLIGTAGFGVAVHLFATNHRITLLGSVVLIILFVVGWLGTSKDLDTSSKPPELYVIAIVSLVAAVSALVWAYFNTDAGKYVRKKGGEFRKGVKKTREDYRDFRRMKRERAIENMERDTRLNNTRINPLFDPISDNDFDMLSE